MSDRNPIHHPLIAITLLSMAMMILGLSVIIFVKTEQEKTPMIFHRTEIIKPDHLYPHLPPSVTTGTYRLRSSWRGLKNNVFATEEATGSAWGISLKEWGLPEKRYLITAAHCVLTGNNQLVDSVDIQIRVDNIKKWIRCKVLICDKDRDAALLEVMEDIPVIFTLGETIAIGSPVLVSGCPVGTTPSTTMGFLTSLDPELVTKLHCHVWQASVPFFYGNSGGPLLDAENLNVVGMLVAGIGVKEGMVPNLAIVIPNYEIKAMLDANLKLDDEKVEIPLIENNK